MSQHDFDITTADANTGITYRAAVNAALQALATLSSGTSAPSSPYAYQLWADTANGLLKIRNAANNAWITIGKLADSALGHVGKDLFDANTILKADSDNTPVALSVPEGRIIGRKSGGSIAALTGAEARGILGTAPFVCGSDADGDMWYRASGALARLPKGEAYQVLTMNSAGTAPQWSALDGNSIAASSIGRSHLKTSTGSVSTTSIAGEHLILPGGEYGFYPQTYCIYTGEGSYSCIMYAQIANGAKHATAATCIHIRVSTLNPGTAYAVQRYVTSSGEIHWIFFLRDILTKRVISSYEAPDHPCFGNGGKPLVVPHPFPDADPNEHEIVVVTLDFDQYKEIVAKTGVDDEEVPDRSVAQVILEDYEIDENETPDWPTTPVTVGLPTTIEDPETNEALPVDWRTIPSGTIIEPTKKTIPKMDYFIVRSLKERSAWV